LGSYLFCRMTATPKRDKRKLINRKEVAVYDCPNTFALESAYLVNPGDFAENLTTEGIELVSLPVGTKVSIGKEVILEITQIGKECHSGCAIFRQVGKCIMPKEGVFARVIRGGFVKAGDHVMRRIGKYG